jgi:hypothetical protein
MNPTPERTEKTPRTDAEEQQEVEPGLVCATFARTLETELNQANAQNEALRWAGEEFLMWACPKIDRNDQRLAPEVAAFVALLTTTPPAKHEHEN